MPIIASIAAWSSARTIDEVGSNLLVLDALDAGAVDDEEPFEGGAEEASSSSSSETTILRLFDDFCVPG